MDLEQKRLYRFWPWLVALVLASFFALNAYLDISDVNAELQERIANDQHLLSETLAQSQIDILQKSSSYAVMLSESKPIAELIKTAYQQSLANPNRFSNDQTNPSRVQLDQLLQPYWERLTKYGLTELNVYIGPSSLVFLRVDRPDRFGDDVSQISKLVPTAIASGLPSSGFEISHYGAAYRAVAPIGIQGSEEVAGAIELAFNAAATNIQGLNQAVVVHNSVVTDNFWGAAKQSLATIGNDSKRNWQIQWHNNSQVVNWQKAGLLQDIKSDRQSWEIQDGDRQYIIVVHQLKNFGLNKNAQVVDRAAVVAWKDVSNYYQRNADEASHIMRANVVAAILAEIGLYILSLLNGRYVLSLIRDHGQQLKQERDLSEQARQRLSLALVSSESGFWEWDITKNRSRFSKEWREVCGLPDSPDGTSDMEEWLSRVHPSDKRDSYNEMIRHIKGETPMFENEYRLRVADGSYKWIFTRGKVVEWTEDGKASLMLGVYSDITGRKKNEIIVTRQQAALRALNEIASLPSVDAEDQLRRALAIGTRFLGLPVGVLGTVIGNEYSVHLSVGRVSELEQTKAPQPLSNFFCEYTIRDRDVFGVDEIGKSEYAKHVSHKIMGIESYIGVPLWLKGNLYGALCFSSDRARHQTYDDLDKDFMRLLARWVGVTLERWQHQKEQEALLERFEKLSNQLPGFLYQYELHPDGGISIPYASAGVENLFGISSIDAMKNAEDIFSRIYNEDAGWVGMSISQSAARLTPWSASYRLNHRKRGVIWVHSEARPEKLEDGSVLWHGFTVDITEEKKSEIKLQEINSLREAIFDAANISIISTDVNGLIKTFNRGAERMLGYVAEEAIDKMSPVQFHLVEEMERYSEKLAGELGWEVELGFDVFVTKCREGGEDENEWSYVRKDGSTMPVVLTVTALRAPDGEITGFLTMARDISELKRIDRMKTEFISTVSHELRTPLTAISGALGIINGGALGDLPDSAKKMLNIAHKNSLRLIHLVNDLLDMEKLVAGKMQFDLREQALIPIIQQTLEDNAAYATQFNVRYELSSNVPSNLEIKVDNQRLQQVMANFLSNAAKFSPEGSAVDVRIDPIFNNVRVSVIDRGPGIPDEFRARIFQKFSQADSSDSRQKGGTGLGLAICKEIIERMGGKIGFESQVGHGSCFYFEIPTHEIFGAHFEKQLDNKGTGARILVVEDDPEVAELLATMLRANNYRVDIAHNAQTGLERLALYQYQVITVDIQLPDFDGITLIRQLRSDAITLRLPVVVISANIDKEFLVNRNDPIFKDVQWLQKPQSAVEVLAAIGRAINQEPS